jgi:outer membrane receptor protein involved in Fe transport
VFSANAGTAHIKGVEFEFTARPINYLTVSFAGSFQDATLARGATLEEYTNNPTLGLTGDAIPNVPRYQFNAGVNYTRPIYGEWQGMLAADITYRDFVNAYFASNSFNLELPPYTLVGLRAGVINGPWSVSLFARNVADVRAQVSAINSTQDPHALLTVQPRTIGVTVSRKF